MIDLSDLSAVREHIARKGLSPSLFKAIAGSDAIDFADVFAPNALLIVEFDVILVGEHSHLVFIPGNKAPAEIITSFPDAGRLRVSYPHPWEGSRHSPERGRRTHRAAVTKQPFSREDWDGLGLLAQQIDEAALNYHFIRQNSNSVTATLLAGAGLPFTDLKGGGVNPGARNLLFDELEGGPQSGRLLVRGANSYVGHRALETRLDRALATDGSTRDDELSERYTRRFKSVN